MARRGARVTERPDTQKKAKYPPVGKKMSAGRRVEREGGGSERAEPGVCGGKSATAARA